MASASVTSSINSATDKWLSERSQAPLDRMKDWLMDVSQPLMERLGTAVGGKRMLDEGGETAELVVLGKLIACNAVEIDKDIVSKVEEVAKLFSEAAERIEMRTGNLSELGHLVGVYKHRAEIYRQVGGLIRNIPEAPPVNDVEKDAMKFLKLRQAQAHVGLRAQVGGPMGTRRGLHTHDSFRLCLDDDGNAAPSPNASFEAPKAFPQQDGSARLENLMQALFRVQDLDGDGMLGEDELIKLNEKIAILHSGRDVDLAGVQSRFRSLFRSQLDPHGNAVPYARFRDYMSRTVKALDPDINGQEMMVEQILNEARSALASVPDTQDSFMDSEFMKTADFGPKKTAEFGAAHGDTYESNSRQLQQSSYSNFMSTASVDPLMSAESQDIAYSNAAVPPTALGVSGGSSSHDEAPQLGVSYEEAPQGNPTGSFAIGSTALPNSIGSRSSAGGTQDGYATKDAARQASSRLALQQSVDPSIPHLVPIAESMQASITSNTSYPSQIGQTVIVDDQKKGSYSNSAQLGQTIIEGEFGSVQTITGDEFRVGDTVSIYSQSADSWLAGRVIKAEGHTVEIEYRAHDGIRRKEIDVQKMGANISRILRRE